MQMYSKKVIGREVGVRKKVYGFLKEIPVKDVWTMSSMVALKGLGLRKLVGRKLNKDMRSWNRDSKGLSDILKGMKSSLGIDGKE